MINRAMNGGDWDEKIGMKRLENIYDVRKNEALNFIISEDILYRSLHNKNNTKEICIIVHLHYPETVEQYMKYLNRVSAISDIYIFSSHPKTLERVRELSCNQNIFTKAKENRGRDLSTLLIAAREKILSYQYFCFLHDKSANAEYLADDVKFWVSNLWGNVLASEKYLQNVMSIFETRPDIGLLVPPEPYGEYNSHWYGDTWYQNFELTQKLAEDMALSADIRKEKTVFTLGTVFWARTSALEKLLKKEWHYEDFPDEPLLIDGTISHALERVIGYVAQDAGYKTGTIMTERYAAELLLRVQEDMRILFSQLKKREQVINLHQIKNLDTREKEIREFIRSHEHIYIYGAGDYGNNMASYLSGHGLRFDGFVVSKGHRDIFSLDGIPVYELQEIDLNEDNGFVISVSYERRLLVEQILETSGFRQYIYGY